MSMPKVVIIGRTNVGKSMLFNRLSVQVKSLTYDYEGVTRDFIKDTVCWQNVCFELFDTGGISLRKTNDPILQAVREKALQLLETADIIIFVVDGQAGIVPEDREISRVAHKLGKPVIVVMNKSDTKQAQEHEHEFATLGHLMVIALSAMHGTNAGELLDSIVKLLPEKPIKEIPEPTFKVVLLGKPNVGKSSLMNVLLNQERSIVDAQAGTTREAISEKIAFYQSDIELTDTPGIRRKRAVDEPLEQLMVKSSLRAMQDADIVLLLVDSSQNAISDQELKLAFYAFEHSKALIILYNKQDLVTDEIKKEFAFNVEPYQYLLDKVEQLSISCKSGKNIGKIMPLVHKVWERFTQEFSATELTMLFKETLRITPLYKQRHPLLVNKVKQIKSNPPTLLMFVNEPLWFGESQLSFFDKVMREKFDLRGVPINFVTRKND
jgi:GTP-binding protein